MRKPNKVIRIIQPLEFIKELHLPRAIPKVYLVDQRAGRAYLRQGFVTVPLWAEKRGKDYLLYYIAHELAHPLSASHLHDFAFYKTFIKICPTNLQYFELEYKPTAAKFGISKH